MNYIEKIEVDISCSGHITNTYLLYTDSIKNKKDENENENKRDENKLCENKVNNERIGVLVDPGDEPQKIIEKIIELNVKVEKILITHAHGDHIGALEKLQLFTHAEIMVHEMDFRALINEEENYSDMLDIRVQHIDERKIILLKDGDKFNVGNMDFEIIHTPGHTSGGICIFEKTSNILLTGDTLFCDSYGRCDLYSGDFDKMVESIKKIFNRFADIVIYPGHGKAENVDKVKRKISMLFAYKGIHLG
ncbi:MAG: MBL fold metallo-hydrolase [Clostridia bacterium]